MILSNLISNAIKYTPEHGKIMLSIERNKTQVTINVGDNGVGISEENKAIIFNRFTRACEQHYENIPGAGIGLALVRELVEKHGGSIELCSEINRGSTFTVTLPFNAEQQGELKQLTTQSTISDTSQYEIDTLLTPQPLVPAEQNSQNNESTLPLILLIDDNTDMLALLVDTLSVDYQCITAQDGEQGLLLATEHLPALVITDVMMPGISGFEVVQQLKENELTNFIPVVLLTARGDSQSRVRGWTEKADEYLEKPFNTLELLARIDNLLSLRHLLRQRYQREFIAPTNPSTQLFAADSSHNNRKNNIEQTHKAHDQFVVKFNQLLEKHFTDENLDANTMASEMACSARQLSRKVKSILDLNLKEALRNFRLKKAAELLNDGISPSLVTQQVGFASHSYFSSCFKAQYGCAPSDFAN
jgi:DNA-binding response OmpR family regulator